MKTQNTIITVLLATLLTGCGVKKQDHQRVLTELEETKQVLEQSQSEITKLRELNTSAENEANRHKGELSSASLRVNELTAEVERLKKQDTYAFTEAGRLLDSGDLNGALRAYTAFVRDFPSSPQASNAKTQISAIEQRLEAQRREAAARAERERKEKEERELAAKLRQGMLTVPQLIPYLHGKTKDQVSDLLGPPDTVYSQGNELVFYNKAYSTIKRSNETVLLIKFSGGIVYSVGLSGEQEYLARSAGPRI